MVITKLIYKAVITLIVFGFINTATAQDYFQYHRNIIKAEEQAFVTQDFRNALKTYNETLRQYDFVFLRDCIIAMELALYINDEKAFIAFTTKAFQNGFAPPYLNYKDLTYIREHPIYNKYKGKLDTLYAANRDHYLKRIDTTSLKKMMELFCVDQAEKNNLPHESERTYSVRYKPLVIQTMTNLQKLIAAKGWPSDKLIGIDQNDIMRQLGFKNMDALDYYNRYKDDPEHLVSKGQYDFDEYILASSLILPIIVHYSNETINIHNKRRNLQYPDEYYLAQIKAGNMHPQDFALLNDWPFDATSLTPVKGDRYFDIGYKPPEILECKPAAISNKEINAYRAMFYIAPIETARAKLLFLTMNKMSSAGGWLGCRL